MSHVNVLEKHQKALAVERPIHVLGRGHRSLSTAHKDALPLPPVLTPPVEIIARIIELGAWDDHLHFPVLVSHVCSRLRDIALSTPMLWTTINFVGGRPPDSVAHRLARSKNVPIDFSATKLDTPGDAAAMLALLLPHVRRLRSMSLEMWEPSSAEVILQGLSIPSAPLLEKLNLVGFSPAPFNPFGGNTPSLKHLSVKGMHLDWDSNLFTTVQTLYMYSPTWTNGTLLSKWTNLKKLTIRSDPLQPIVLHYTLPHIVLPDMDTLELNGITEEDIVRMLSHVEMPNLRRMLFTHIKDSPNPVATNIFPLPSMRQLRLHATEMCQDNLLSVLRKVRNLDSISFEDSSPIPTFIHELTPGSSTTSSDDWLIPSITSFKVVAFEKDNAHRVYDDTDIADALSRMMWKRKNVKVMSIRMCVFEGERDDVTRHAADWGEERRYKTERKITVTGQYHYYRRGLGRTARLRRGPAASSSSANAYY